jgi:hypothetical protein
MDAGGERILSVSLGALLAFLPVAGVLPIASTFAAFGALTGLVMLRLTSGLRRAEEEVVAQEDCRSPEPEVVADR